MYTMHEKNLMEALKKGPPIKTQENHPLCLDWNNDWSDSIMTQLELYKVGKGRLQTN